MSFQNGDQTGEFFHAAMLQAKNVCGSSQKSSPIGYKKSTEFLLSASFWFSVSSHGGSAQQAAWCHLFCPSIRNMNIILCMTHYNLWNFLKQWSTWHLTDYIYLVSFALIADGQRPFFLTPMISTANLLFRPCSDRMCSRFTDFF